MKIELLCSLNSGQFNKGDVIDISKEEANRMIRAGHAKECGPATKESEPKPIEKTISTRAAVAAKEKAAPTKKNKEG